MLTFIPTFLPSVIPSIIPPASVVSAQTVLGLPTGTNLSKFFSQLALVVGSLVKILPIFILLPIFTILPTVISEVVPPVPTESKE